jgi:hypothetical protein
MILIPWFINLDELKLSKSQGSQFGRNLKGGTGFVWPVRSVL